MLARKPISRISRTFVLSAAACSSSVLAQQEPLSMLSEQDYFANVPIVLTATRLAQPKRDVPAAITIIDRELIEATGARNIADLFRLVPGFQVTYANGHNPFVSYHGLVDEFARRMQVLVDGRSVYASFDGGVRWSDLPLTIDNIERIEVIRGPNSAAYGANSFLGVINIITRHASETIGSFVHTNKGYDTNATDAFVRYGNTSGDFDYRITLGYQQDDGFENLNDSREIKIVTFRGDYRASTNDSFNIQMGYNGGTRGLGYPDRDLDPSHDATIDSQYEEIRWWHTKGADNEVRIQFYHNSHNHSEIYSTNPLYDVNGINLGGLRVPLIWDDLHVERYDLEVQHTVHPFSRLRLAWGGSFRSDQVESETYLGHPGIDENHIYRLFAHSEWRLHPSLVANIGAMYEKNGLTGENVSPRVAVNYHLTPTHTLRASFSQAIRNPVLYEEKMDYRISGEIPGLGTLVNQIVTASGGVKPERITSREIGYVFDNDDGLSVDIKLYRDDIYDLITAYNDYTVPDLFDGKSENVDNVGNATVTGGEAQIDFRYERNGRIFLSYAYTEIDYVNTNPAVIQQRAFAESAPRHSASVVITQAFTTNLLRHKLFASAGYYYYDKITWLGQGNTVGPVRRLDLRLGQNYKLRRTSIDVSATLQNALGAYPEFRNDHLFDTRGYISFAMEIL